MAYSRKTSIESSIRSPSRHSKRKDGNRAVVFTDDIHTARDSGLYNSKPPTPTDLEKKAYLTKLYTDVDSPVAYSGLTAVLDKVAEDGIYTISAKDVQDFLLGLDSYALYRKANKNFPRSRIVTYGNDVVWQTDTLAMKFYKEWNENYAYIVVFIDSFSRFLYTRPLHAITGEKVTEALKDILTNAENPKTIMSDKGSEYKSRVFKSYLASLHIKHVFTQTEVKASLAERVIKTLRVRLGRAMRGRNNFDWASILSEVTAGYNNTVHSVLNCSPQEAMCLRDNSSLWHWQYLRNDKARRTGPKTTNDYLFKVGDRVRKTMKQIKFRDRAYDEKYDRMTLNVASRNTYQGFHRYALKTDYNKLVPGFFYENQLIKSHEDQNSTYHIEKELERKYFGRGRNRKLFVKVKWLGYPDEFNTWIEETELINL